MSKRKIIVGSRDSKLAVAQSELVMAMIAKSHPEIELELVTMKTTGDIILDKRLDKIGGKGLFVKELDKALREGKIDISVHSLKDLPMEVSEDLPLVAYSKRENPLDVLVFPKGASCENRELPLGTSSLRRELQLKEIYCGWQAESIRGNLQTRLSKLDSGQYGGIVLAYAGIARLGLQDRIGRVFTADEILPPAGQGIMVVQGRAGEDYGFLDCVNDKEAELCAKTERAFVTYLDGGCSSPIGAFAEISHGEILLRGLYYDEGMCTYKKGKISGNITEGETMAITLAKSLKEGKTGKVWLVGAGPGDAGLFTLKGKQVLDQAEVVVYDKLVGQGILSMIPTTAELIFVGKAAGNHAVPQHEINRILLREALKGKRVVRLKGGDPFLFGRGGEELELLSQNAIPFEIVPGITSAISVPAYNGIPVTHRDFVSSLHIITGHTKKMEEADIDYEALVRLRGTLVFLMGVTAMAKICKGLLAAGMSSDMPAAILERGTTAHQRRVISNVTDLPKDAEKAGIKTPAIIVVGKVCALEKDFHWAEDRRLGGLKVAITRPKDRSSSLGEKLSMLGAEVVMLPTIETKLIENNVALEEALNDIRRFDYAAFTSPVGVTVFFQKMRNMKKDIRALGSIKFAAIGSATKAELEKMGILVDLTPDTYSGAALGRLLAEEATKWGQKIGKEPHILIPRAKIGTEQVTAPLDEAGIKYSDIAIYDTFEAKAGLKPHGIYADTVRATEKLIDFAAENVDYVAFTSASTVRGFVTISGLTDFSEIKAVCIGEKTAEEAEKYGMKIFVAEKATIDSMVECFLRCSNERK